MQLIMLFLEDKDETQFLSEKKKCGELFQQLLVTVSSAVQ